MHEHEHAHEHESQHPHAHTQNASASRGRLCDVVRDAYAHAYACAHAHSQVATLEQSMATGEDSAGRAYRDALRDLKGLFEKNELPLSPGAWP